MSDWESAPRPSTSLAIRISSTSHIRTHPPPDCRGIVAPNKIVAHSGTPTPRTGTKSTATPPWAARPRFTDIGRMRRQAQEPERRLALDRPSGELQRAARHTGISSTLSSRNLGVILTHRPNNYYPDYSYHPDCATVQFVMDAEAFDGCECRTGHDAVGRGVVSWRTF